MKIKVQNIGVLKEAELELADLTVISGKNNTGKTFLAYLVYGLFYFWEDLADVKKFSEKELNNFSADGVIRYDLQEFKSKKDSYLKKLSKQYIKRLPNVFNSTDTFFKDCKIEISIDDFVLPKENSIQTQVEVNDNNYLEAVKKENSTIVEIVIVSEASKQELPDFVLNKILNRVLVRIIFGKILGKVHAITSERTGVHLFQRELDLNKNMLVDQLIQLGRDKSSFNPFDFLTNSTSRYSVPVRKNIDFVRNIKEIIKKHSFIYKDHPKLSKSIEKTLGIRYMIEEDDVQIKTKLRGGVDIPLHLASTSVRAMLDLFIYIKYIAKEGDLLIIDEPELNLHPENQIALARVFSKLANVGIKVIFTTHSDYLLKELNNLILLSREFPHKADFLKRFDYEKSEIISPENINLYITEKGLCKKVAIDEYGLEKTSFDDAIDKINEVSEELLFELDKTNE